MENVNGAVPVASFDVSGGDDAELLVGLVIGTFGDSGRRECVSFLGMLSR